MKPTNSDTLEEILADFMSWCLCGEEECQSSEFYRQALTALTERELDIQIKQLDFLISNAGTITLRGYGGEEKGEIKVISVEQLEKYKRDISELTKNTNPKEGK